MRRYQDIWLAIITIVATIGVYYAYQQSRNANSLARTIQKSRIEQCEQQNKHRSQAIRDLSLLSGQLPLPQNAKILAAIQVVDDLQPFRDCTKLPLA